MVLLGSWSVQGIKISLWVIVWDPNNTIDVGRWSICGGGQLERFYSISVQLKQTSTLKLKFHVRGMRSRHKLSKHVSKAHCGASIYPNENVNMNSNAASGSLHAPIGANATANVIELTQEL